jgi:hypothetical protein
VESYLSRTGFSLSGFRLRIHYTEDRLKPVLLTSGALL